MGLIKILIFPFRSQTSTKRSARIQLPRWTDPWYRARAPRSQSLVTRTKRLDHRRRRSSRGNSIHRRY